MIELVKLFISFFKVGLFSFGGGFAMIPFIQEEVINKNGWVSSVEFLDMIAISQVTPGPIAINAATFIGSKVGGLAGGIIATTAVVLPSFIIVMILIMITKKFGKSHLMEVIYKGVKPAVMALILSAIVSVGRETVTDLKTVLIAIGVFIVLNLTKLNIIVVMMMAGVVGFIIY